MKKIILPILFLITFCGYSQEFSLTSENFKEKNNPEKNHYVLDVQDKTQSDLFKKAKMYFTRKFKGMKNDGYNEVGSDQIVMDVQGNKEKMIIINMTGANVWNVSNRYELNFKDGKIMIKPVFRELTNTIERNVTAGMTSLFNKKGQPRKEKAILFIENETNLFISDFIKEMKSEASNDW